ncbi:phosphatase PAP2 family protein [Actinocorallia longicatena]|uniref:Phosphatase PAP2 family protein n=1 Tax=Actinocorallia longicatena TaxID=111803 RepID=A0ABP6QE35_9ACTN
MVQIAPVKSGPPPVSGRRAGSETDARSAPLAPRVPPVWRELLLIVLFYSGYMVTRILINDPGGTDSAYAHARQIFGWERATGLDVELGLNEFLLRHQHLAFAANIFYLSAHFVVTLGVVVWLYRRRPRHYAWFRAGILAATALALVGFWLYPLAPPRFMEGFGFVDPVVHFSTPGLYSSGASTAMANQYAAMPSMHAGWAIWCGIALVTLGRQWWVRLAGVLYPATTVLVIMSTANHYVLDAVAGVALIVVSLWASWWAYRWSGRGRTAAQ